MKGASVVYIDPCTLDFAWLNPRGQKGRVQVSYMPPLAPFFLELGKSLGISRLTGNQPRVQPKKERRFLWLINA
jgi:hypothetical protein